ncbi:MFS transporter [Catenulispora sp. NL8]|uniref:MFS transporter n=1 Tax=Catenulispora pinistramenti TaxID=2705254 RepID=A0ABS5KP00_9ACTN|nr:MFS transporter [Catenulispora pinistramenti]MBS2547773.1 MFS transporter [Catenulispora pinistramenti]
MRRFRAVVAGYSVSAYGSYLDSVALALFVYEASKSSLAVGVYLALRLGSGVVSGITGGRLLERVPHRRAMIVTCLIQALALFGLSAAPHGSRVALCFVLAVIAGYAGTLFAVSLRSMIPEVVGDDRRDRANSHLVMGRSLAMVAGYATAGLVVADLGFTAAFLIDAATYLVCAAAVLGLPRDAGAAPAEPAEAAGTEAAGIDAGKPSRGPLAGSRLAVAALRAVPLLLLMVGLRAVDALGSSSHNVALPVYSATADAAHPADFVARFWLCWAIGNILVQQAVQLGARRYGFATGASGFGVGTIVMSAAFIAAFAGLGLWPTVVIAVVAGAADGFTEVSYTSSLQTLPVSARTHAFGLSATVENAGFGIGMIVCSGLLERLTPLEVVGGLHLIAIGVAVVFVATTRRRSTAAAVPPLGGLVRSGASGAVPAEEGADA